MTDEPSRTETAPSKGRTYTLVGVMGVLALAFALQFPAMSRWQQAQAAAEEIYGTEEDHIPLKFMKAIGQTPMVKEDEAGLTQIYHWKGGLMSFEIRIHFVVPYEDKPGVYGSADGVEGGMKLRFAATDLSGFELAQEATGSTFAVQPQLEEPPSALTQSGAPPSSGDQNPRGAALPPTGKGGGGQKGKGGTFNRMLAPPDELELTEGQARKWDAAVKRFQDNSRELFTSGLGRDEIGTMLREQGEQLKEDLEEFLTEEQIEKLDEIRNRRPRFGEGKGGD